MNIEELLALSRKSTGSIDLDSQCSTKEESYKRLSDMINKYEDNYWNARNRATPMDIMNKFVKVGDEFEQLFMTDLYEINLHAHEVVEALSDEDCRSTDRYLLYLDQVLDKMNRNLMSTGGNMTILNYKTNEYTRKLYATLRLSCLDAYFEKPGNIRLLEEKHFGERYRGLLRLALDGYSKKAISFERLFSLLCMVYHEVYYSDFAILKEEDIKAVFTYWYMCWPKFNNTCLSVVEQLKNIAAPVDLIDSEQWGRLTSSMHRLAVENPAFIDSRHVNKFNIGWDDTMLDLCSRLIKELDRQLTTHTSDDVFEETFREFPVLVRLMEFIGVDFGKCEELQWDMYYRFAAFLIMFLANTMHTVELSGLTNNDRAGKFK